MKPLYRIISIHLLGCLIFLSIPIFSSPDFGAIKNMIGIAPFVRSFLTFFFLLLFFYLNYYFLIGKVYFKKKYFWYFLAVFVCYLLTTYLPSVFVPQEAFHERFRNHGPDFRRPPHEMNFFMIHARSLLQFLSIFFLTLLLRTNAQWRHAKQDKLKAEVSYMKAQINPHFLFNTLNSLYALTIEKSDLAPDAVLKLSNMMRYVVTESTTDFVSLEKEINYIQDYIAMQRLRIDDQNHLNVTVSGDPKGKVIMPLVVIPFIENAFKYGVNNDEDWKIDIAIKISDTDFVLDVANNIVAISFPEYAATEKGIENTQKRLDFHYPAKHELVVDDTPEHYRVHLKIDLS